MRNLALSIFCLLLIQISCRQTDSTTYDMVIKNVSLFDGFENMGKVNIAINQDSIASITVEKMQADTIIDGEGKYMVPGLINCHIHSWNLENLQESYNAGVLAVVNLHQVQESIDKNFRQYRDSLGYAVFYSSGIAATVEDGHPTQYGKIETVNDSITPAVFVKNRIDNGADLIKIIRDGNPSPSSPTGIPTLTFDQIEELIVEAQAHEKKAVVHIQHLPDLLQICKYKPNGFAHIWFYKDELTEEILGVIKKSGAFIIPTALTQKRILKMAESDTGASKDWSIKNLTPMDRMKREIAKLNQIKIPLLAGTDPPNTGINYGSDLIEELFIYSDAGLSNIEVLKTATGNPSKFLDIDGLGQLKVGSKASFLLLNGDPLKDLNALKEIHAIWKNGKTK